MKALGFVLLSPLLSAIVIAILVGIAGDLDRDRDYSGLFFFLTLALIGLGFIIFG